MSSYASHAALLLLVCFTALSAAVNYFEREQVRMFATGPNEPWHSPAQINAFDELESLFTGDDSQNKEFGQPPNLSRMMKLMQEITSDTRAEILTSEDWEEFGRYNNSLRAQTEAVESASEGDYMQVSGSAPLNLVRLRICIKVMAIRSQLAVRDGRTLDAVRNIRTLYRLSGVLRGTPWLIGQEIGIYSGRLANGAAYNALIQMQGNEQGILALADALQSVAREMRMPLDWEALRRGEAGALGVIVPNSDLVIGASIGVSRDHRVALMTWLNFDLVRLGLALELYKIQNGKYPEHLDDLIPGYIMRLPNDPIEGQPYKYRIRVSGEYELYSPSIPKDWTRNGIAGPLTFPLSETGKGA
jgi:hypothetical protein